MIPRVILEKQNFKDEFSELVLGFLEFGPLIRLALKTLRILFPVVKRAPRVQEADVYRDISNISTGYY